eukprot:TRINITY_DN14319_c0_g1_i1.p1 TRINITY_DN14319_c0_g1~~TRINITY_DN14319_c0_g1_i1.p1  ORF type:complete len:332 (-),score=47.07 TRINITY_DN14319_c0_g1_i1:73-1068(-)
MIPASGASVLVTLLVFLGFQQTVCSLTYPVICANGTQLDAGSLQCSACPTGTVTSADGFSCVCLPNYIKVVASPVSFTCQACPGQQVATQDQSRCLPCTGTNTTLAAGGLCTCPAGYALREYDADNLLLTQKTCVLCPDGQQTAGDNPYLCQPCPLSNMSVVGGVCQCNTGLVLLGAACVNPTAAQAPEISQDGSATTVKFNDLITSVGGSPSAQSVDSAIFHEMYLPTATLCLAYSDRKSCQALGNLCVLQMYDKTSAACSTFMKIEDKRRGSTNGYSDWHPTLPWLYYNGLPNDILTASDVGLKVAFRSSQDVIRLCRGCTTTACPMTS